MAEAEADGRVSPLLVMLRNVKAGHSNVLKISERK